MSAVQVLQAEGGAVDRKALGSLAMGEAIAWVNNLAEREAHMRKLVQLKGALGDEIFGIIAALGYARSMRNRLFALFKLIEQLAFRSSVDPDCEGPSS